MLIEIVKPGDLVFAHTSDFVGRAIRLGERLRQPSALAFVVAVAAVIASIFVLPVWATLSVVSVLAILSILWLDLGQGGDKWNHVCLIDRIEDGVAYVLQADAHGVTNDMAITSLGEYKVLALPEALDANQVLFFARQQLGCHYSWFTILTMAFDVLTPLWLPSLTPVSRKQPHWICSTLTAESMRYAGWFRNWPDPMMVAPSEVFRALKSE